jgi:predicted permease
VSRDGPPERFYRFLLRLFLPRALRDEAESELVEIFRDAHARRRERGTSAVTFWVRTIADAVVTGVMERIGSDSRTRRAAPDRNRDQGGVGMEHLLKDLRFAVRQLFRRPGFTAVLVLTLALGIGANTAVFSVVNAVLLRPLPYPDQGDLAVVFDQFPGLNLTEFPASGPEYIEYREQNRSFEQLAAYTTAGTAITGDGEPERVQFTSASWQLFPAIGLEPEIGRVFADADDRPGAEAVVVLSHALWQRRYAGDPGALGRTLILNGTPQTIVGVMPADFRFPEPDVQLWVPLGLDPASPGGRGSHYLSMVGRLRPGVTLASARAEVGDLMERWSADPAVDHSWNAENHPAVIQSLRDQMVGDVSRPLWIMLGAVVVVLLIACANVANLLLVRGEGRVREISVRTAMGAGRWRIVSQLLTESVVMAGAGGLAGLALAWAGVRGLVAIAPPDLPRADEIGVDPMVLSFTVGVTLLAGVLFGLAPALQAGRTDVQASLREEGRSGTSARGRVRVRQLLVVSETALAIVLLVAAGLLLQSFRRLSAVDPGFRPEQVITMSVSVPAFKYPDFPQVDAFHRELRERVAAIPGVQTVGEVRTAPLAGSLSPNDVEVEGFDRHQAGDEGPPMNADVQLVSAGYFEAMGIDMVEGRGFDERDDITAPVVVVVSEELAKRYWPDRSAIGGRIRQSGYQPALEWGEVVGVVEDIRHEGLDQPVRGTLYFVFPQSVRTWYLARAMTLVVRTNVDPQSVIGAARSQLLEMDSDVPLYQVETMSRAIADSTSTQRFTMLLQLVFALVALTLAAIGLYGVMSFTVARRTPEIGIRMALGAERGEVLRMVVGQGMGIVLVAAVLGVGGALAAGRVLSGLLYGVTARDPVTYATVVGTLLLVAFVACWIPARRASAVDPGSALRYE